MTVYRPWFLHANSTGDGAAKARGMLRVIKTFKFIAVLCFLNDVLLILTRCSKVFQKDGIDIHQVLNMLTASVATVDDLDHPAPTLQDLYTQCQTAGEFQGIPLQFSDAAVAGVTAIAKAFVMNLKTEINKRFPPTVMQVLKDLGTILDPSHLPQAQDQIRGHGEEALERLLARYTKLNAEEARRQYKALLGNHREKSFKDMCKHIITQCNDLFPEFSTLAHISLTIPITSVPSERGFSSHNIIHTPLRSSLSVKAVDNKMRIKD